MSHIFIEEQHSFSLEEGHKLLLQVAHDLADKYQGSYSLTEQGLNFQGPGLKGHILVTPQFIRVEATLGILLRPLKSLIENQIRDEIHKFI